MYIRSVARYIFKAGKVTLSVGGAALCRQELWIGIETDRPLDVAEFSRDHGYDLIPADGMREDELQSVGVRAFARWR